MAFLDTLQDALLAAIIFMTLLFVIAYLRNRRYDLVDVGWGLVFIVTATVVYLISPVRTGVMTVVLILVAIWGLRLANHILKRWLLSSVEDPRYIELRKKWPKRLVDFQVYVRIYLAQALLAVIVLLPVLVVMNETPKFGWIVYLGVTVWLIGFVCESIADRQLRQYLASHKGSDVLMTKGLWKYSRHPNYFGEIMQWVGMGIIASTTVLWWVGWIGPLVIAGLIIFVSGIPPAERRAEKKTGWAEYQRTTSVLIPLPKR